MANKTSDKTSAKTPTKAATKTSDKKPAKASAKTSDKKSTKAATKTPDKKPAKASAKTPDKKTTKTPDKESDNQVIFAHEEGWGVRKEGSDHTTAVYETRIEALDRAREIAENQGGEVYIIYTGEEAFE